MTHEYTTKRGTHVIQPTLDGVEDEYEGQDITNIINAPKKRAPRPTGMKYKTKAIKANGGMDPKVGIQLKMFESTKNIVKVLLEEGIIEEDIHKILDIIER